LAQLKKANNDSDSVREGLTAFLEQKREAFPRLYFLSNEELIDIFGRADDLIDELIYGTRAAFI